MTIAKYSGAGDPEAESNILTRLALEARIRDMPHDACDQAWIQLVDDIKRMPPEPRAELAIQLSMELLHRHGV